MVGETVASRVPKPITKAAGIVVMRFRADAKRLGRMGRVIPPVVRIYREHVQAGVVNDLDGVVIERTRQHIQHRAEKVPEGVAVTVRGRARRFLFSDRPLQRAHADEARDQEQAEPHLLPPTKTICICECYQ